MVNIRIRRRRIIISLDAVSGRGFRGIRRDSRITLIFLGRLSIVSIR